MRPQRGFPFRAFRFSRIANFWGERWERIESAGLLGSSPGRGVYVCLLTLWILWDFFFAWKKKNEHTLTPVLRVKFEKETCLKGRRAGFL